MTRTRYRTAALALCAAIAAGCSEGVTRHSIAGPTPIPTDTGLTAGLAVTADRSTAGRPATGGEVAAWAASHGWAASADGIVVEATESITAVSGTCPTKSITVRGVPVAVTAATTFTAPVTCEGLAVGDTVTISALLTYTASGFTVTATTIAPAGDSNGGGGTPGTGPGAGGGRKAQGQGVIGEMSGACPALTLIITGTRVSLSGSTEFVNSACDKLKPGMHVKIDAALSPGGTAVAEKIEVLAPPGRPVSGDGVVGAVSGTCPAVTIMVRGINVITTSATTFSGGACSDIRPGTDIDVTGTWDGIEVSATAVEIKRLRPGR